MPIVQQLPKKIYKKKKIKPNQEPDRDIVVSEAIIRPTGLLDPLILIKPIANQVDDILEQVRQRIQSGQRVLITTLTKKFAEELDLYMKQINIKSAYIHSDVEALERLDILADLRRGKYDVLIGINLLREGLDLPEVSLVAIFDADKEGFLRSKTSLIQIIGRAARHSDGTVIMYADNVTDSMQQALDETERRRKIQQSYNKKHGITPKTTAREIKTIAEEVREEIKKDLDYGRAGAVLTQNGFIEVEDSFDSVEISSRFSRDTDSKIGRKKAQRKTNNSSNTSNSIHGNKKQSRTTRGRQVYADFNQKKEEKMTTFQKASLSKEELQSKLQTAIEQMDFEMAAAIRDIINSAE